MTTWTGSVPTIAAGATTGVAASLATYRDVMKAAAEPWTSYTPTWTASAGVPAVGNGTLVGKYAQVNKLIDFRIELTFGSTTTMGTAGAGQRFTLPASPASSQRHRFVGTAFDSGIGDYTVYFRWVGPYLEVVAQPTTAGGGDRLVTNTVPFTWATGDVLMVQGRYEAA